MPPSEQHSLSPSRFPVSVIVERQQEQHGRWSLSRWEAVGVVAGEDTAGQDIQRTVIRSDDVGEQYLWTGFTVELYKDGAEGYWTNLVGNTPSLYVVCREEDDEELTPFLVTADCGEAGMHQEIDDTVFSVPMPREVHEWVERYVVENYVPQEKKKRKRKNWLEDSIYVQGPQGQKPGRR
ncbi:MAG: DUF3305 domain-containing protein [Acidiferrobacterales bacterium]